MDYIWNIVKAVNVPTALVLGFLLVIRFGAVWWTGRKKQKL